LEDKMGGGDMTGRGANELAAWLALLLHLRLYDSFLLDEFRKLTSKKFTWDNRRNAPDMICSRLDRIYVDSTIRELGGQVGIWNTLPHISDHAPIFLKLRKTTARVHRSITFNRQLLTTVDGKELLRSAWRQAIDEDPSQPIDDRIATAVRKVKEASDQETRRKKIDWEKDFADQFVEVYAAELDLQDHWNNQEIRKRLNEAQADLHEIRQSRLEKKYSKQAATWVRIGDRCNKQFFDINEGKRRPHIIKELNDGGKILFKQEDMTEYVNHFYKRLYTQEQGRGTNVQHQQECLASVPQSVTKTQNEFLTRP
jgi:hypothetical protein